MIKKRLGQNFLTNKGIAEKLVKAADIKSDDLVLEIGPGKGILTKEIAKKAKKVIAVEKDKELIATLNKELKDYNNIKIINKDILKYDLPDAKYKVVANLPFYITSPVIRRLLEKPPELIVLIIQKEVAQRITAQPPRMNLLAVSVQVYAETKIISYVSKGSFRPTPKVDSAIIKIIPKKNISLPKNFFKILKAGFSFPRKQLINNLSKIMPRHEIETVLKKTSISPEQRAETLSIEDWKKLAINYSNMV